MTKHFSYCNEAHRRAQYQVSNLVVRHCIKCSILKIVINRVFHRKLEVFHPFPIWRVPRLLRILEKCYAPADMRPTALDLCAILKEFNFAEAMRTAESERLAVFSL